MRGGFDGSTLQAVNTFGVMLPLDHPMVAGSKGTITSSLMESTKSYSVSHLTKEINLKTLQLGLEENIPRIASEFGFKPEDVTPAVREHLDQIHYLRKMISPEMGADESMIKLAQKSINNRVSLAKGHSIHEGALMQEAARHLRGNVSEAPIIGARSTLFQPANATATSIMAGSMESTAERVIGLDMKVHVDSSGKRGYIYMDYLKDPGPIVKLMVGSSTKVGVQGVASRGQVGVFGEQFAVEAGFAKMKRSDFSGWVEAHVSRIRRQANLQLTTLTQQHSAHKGLKQYQKSVLDKTARSLTRMAGLDPNTQAGRDFMQHLLKDVLKVRYNDQIDIVATPRFTKALETMDTGRVMDGMKEMGLTLRHALEISEDAGMDRARLTELYEGYIDDIVSGIDDELVQVRGGKERKLLQTTKRRLLETKRKGLFDGKLDEGALIDFHMDSATRQHSLAYQVQLSLENIQDPATSGTDIGNAFERATGRVTNEKRVSALSTALIQHSMSYGMHGSTGLAGNWHQAWLATMSGMGSMDDKYFQEVLEAELDRLGITNANIARDIRWDIDEKAFVYRPPAGGQEVVLNVNPYTTLSNRARLRAGILGMIRGEMRQERISGMPMGDQSRVLDVVFDGRTDLGARRWSADDITRQFGRNARVWQHLVMGKGLDPETVTKNMVAMQDASRAVYVGNPGGGVVTGNMPSFTPTESHYRKSS